MILSKEFIENPQKYMLKRASLSKIYCNIQQVLTKMEIITRFMYDKFHKFDNTYQEHVHEFVYIVLYLLVSASMFV